MAKHKLKKKSKEKKEFNLSKQDHLGHFIWLQVHRKSHNVFCNDIYCTKIIYTVQINLEIDLVGE